MKIKEKVLKDLKENWICANNTDLVKTGIDLTITEVMKLIDKVFKEEFGKNHQKSYLQKQIEQKMEGNYGSNN